MASSTVLAHLCSVVECKRDANALCLHCDTHVCTRHYLEHVKETNQELLPLADELNLVINTLQCLDVTRICHFAVEQIEQWRRKSHQRIDELCDEKKTILTQVAELKLEEERSVSKNFNHLIQQHINQSDASHHEVQKVKKDIAALKIRCSNLSRPDFCYVEMKPLGPSLQSLTIKARQFSYFTGGGSLLRLEHQIVLNEWVGMKGQRWKLLYKAVRDGFQSADFHRCADNQGPTLTIIQSKEHEWLFGGYTSKEWTSTEGYAEDKDNPFLFTLINPHNIVPTRYTIKADHHCYAVVHGLSRGPTFGDGFDLHVCNESETTVGSRFDFPLSYTDTTGKGALTFTGNKQFQTSDIEVYRLA